MTDTADIAEDIVEARTFDGGTVAARVLRRRWVPLRSHARAARPPVLCLPGHLRPARTLEPFARALLADEAGPDRVALLDYRGRGLSTPRAAGDDYSLSGDAADVVAWLDAVGWHEIDVVGSARGGLVAMMMAPVRPGAARRVVLNDIGPVLDGVGLARLRLEAARWSVPASWDDAERDASERLATRYGAVTEARPAIDARLEWDDENGRPASAVDATVLEGVAAIDPDEKVDDLWPEFRTLATRPILLLRAADGDMLTDATVERMREEARDLRVETVAGHGHPTVMHVPPVQEAVSRFLVS